MFHPLAKIVNFDRIPCKNDENLQFSFLTGHKYIWFIRYKHFDLFLHFLLGYQFSEKNHQFVKKITARSKIH